MPKYKSYDAKRDANEHKIIAALIKFGASVEKLDNLDLLVGHKGRTFLMEVKNPDQEWKITPKQRDFINTWRGSPLWVVTNEDQAINVLETY